MQSLALPSLRRATWVVAAMALAFGVFAAQSASTSAQSTPSIQVSKTEVNPAGDTITVTGTGFLPSLATGTRPPLAGQAAGVYIAFGSFADTWKPSEGAPGSARPTTPIGEGGALIWAVPEAARAIVGQDASVTLNPDGSFTATLDVREGYEGALPDGNYGIYTYAGSGAVQPLFETYTPITFTGAQQPSPTVPATTTVAPTTTATTPAATATQPAPGAPTTGTGPASDGSQSALYLVLGGVVLLMGSSAMVAATVRNRRS